MTVAIERDPIYRGRRFQSEIIELCVRWYLTYRLSYRDLVEMLAEARRCRLSHDDLPLGSAIRARVRPGRGPRHAKAVHPSLRVDETAISVRVAAIDISIRRWTSWVVLSISAHCARIVVYRQPKPSFKRP